METNDLILIKFATRSRPEKALYALDNIYETIANKENYRIILTIDSDDFSMYNKAILTEIKNRLNRGYKIIMDVGTSKNKIDAINRGVEKCKNWGILINFSDDMKFEKIGWDTTIRKHMNLHFNNTDGCLHYDDGFAGDRCCTLSIMNKKYYDRFGFIYNPVYESLWCDNEYTEIAQNLGKMQYYPEILFKHYHPSNVGGFIDEQYIKTEGLNDKDYKTYQRRKEIINSYRDKK